MATVVVGFAVVVGAAVLYAVLVVVGADEDVVVGQAGREQGTTCESVGQGAPPYEGEMRIVRVTVATPVPQVTEHGDDATDVQLETTQF